MGLELGIFDKKGAWYSYDGSNVAQGKKNMKYYLINNPNIKEEILNKIENQKNHNKKY
ncbi:hypothetical protein NW067_04110 [Mycoplasmopsis cynos]|nr:hypothetical protein NW067_04110 [Mycoplasmopsis cynos]UWV93460.1 hypothetical protein NW062_05890 [Mycoplasmopsis cynos]